MIQFNLMKPQSHHEASELDRSMMRRAIELARQAGEMDEVPVGAVVYQGSRILTEAFNRRECDVDPVAHAEILAMRAAAEAVGGWRLNECSMAVTLEPCAMCAGGIVNARLGRLIYGASDPKMGAVESLYRICEDKRMNHQPAEIIRGVLAPECRGLLREFFKQKRLEKKNARRGT